MLEKGNLLLDHQSDRTTGISADRNKKYLQNRIGTALNSVHLSARVDSAQPADLREEAVTVIEEPLISRLCYIP